jgi:hypothetical protein
MSDFLDITSDTGREAQRDKALDFAKLYLVFTEGRGKQLLEFWTSTIEAVDTSADSSHAQYAYAEGRRAFIRGIKRQIELANSSGLRF